MAFYLYFKSFNDSHWRNSKAGTQWTILNHPNLPQIPYEYKLLWQTVIVTYHPSK
jgi:hypothetical protein